MRTSTIPCIGLLLMFAAHTTTFAAEPKTEEEKTLYALGVAVSQNIAPFNLSEAELEMVKAGFTDGALQKQPKIDVSAYFPTIRELQGQRMAAAAEVEKKAGQAYLDKAAAAKGAKKTASGLVITTLKEGSGPSPTGDGHRQGALSRHVDRTGKCSTARYSATNRRRFL